MSTFLASVMLLIAIILGLMSGLAFLVAGVWPMTFGLETMPLLLRALLLLFGSVMLLCSVFGIRHAMQERHVLRSIRPDRISAKVEVHEDSDSTTYLVVATVSDQVWAVPAYYSKGIARLEAGDATEVLAWRNPKTGAPIVFSVDGHSIRTYPHATRR